MPDSLFITGTDTNAGKTWVLCELLKAYRAQGIDAVGFKPVECGAKRTDSTAIYAACGDSGITMDEINPIWYQTPVAPSVAAHTEGERWDLSRVLEIFETLRKRHELVLVEGAGGWLVPITENYLVSHLAIELNLSVLVVAANRLGCLNHTALTVNQIARDGLDCRAVILNEVNEPGDDVSVIDNLVALMALIDVPGMNWAHGEGCSRQALDFLSEINSTV